jgi:hypothetical protein
MPHLAAGQINWGLKGRIEGLFLVVFIKRLHMKHKTQQVDNIFNFDHEGS